MAMFILFAGCENDGDAASSSARLIAETVNCNTTTNRVVTEGNPQLTCTIVIADQGETPWCSFNLNTQVSEFSGNVGAPAFLYLKQNTLDTDRTATIEVRYSDNYTTTLTLTQMAFSLTADYDQGWGEQPAYRAGSDYIYKTYHTTLANGRYVRNYSVCYDRRKHVSHWVAYPVFSDYTSGRGYQTQKNDGRTNAWAYDDTQTEYQASRPYYRIIGRTITQPAIAESDQQNIINSYGAGGYDRGHMLGSATRYSTWNTNAQTFYPTNMMPQNSALNQNIWSTLESKERSWQVSDTLFVVTGTHFANSTTINNSNGPIAVPSHCWKVMLRTRNGKTGKPISACTAAELKSIGFRFTNNSAGAATSIADAACSVAEIERLTGFEFFRNLSSTVADEVKKQEKYNEW